MKNKILVCDDDGGIIDVAHMLLTGKGYTVRTVQEGSEVLAAVDEFMPDLILLDIWMPGFDGETLTREIKKKRKTAHIPVVIMSAHQDIMKRASEAGADGYISKPFDIAEFEKTSELYLRG